jgi:hypothetical protein
MEVCRNVWLNQSTASAFCIVPKTTSALNCQQVFNHLTLYRQLQVCERQVELELLCSEMVLTFAVIYCGRPARQASRDIKRTQFSPAAFRRIVDLRTRMMTAWAGFTPDQRCCTTRLAVAIRKASLRLAHDLPGAIPKSVVKMANP